MKNGFLGVVVFASLLCGINVHTASADNIINSISNPSVEEGSRTMPTDWARSKNGNNVSIFSYNQSGHEGNRSLSINVTKYLFGESYWYFNPVSVSPNTIYEYREHYTATMATKLYARITSINGTETTTFLTDINPSNTWSEIVLDIPTSSDASKMTVLHVASSLGSLQTDSFSLAVKDSTPIPPDPVPEPDPEPTPEPTPSNNPIPNSSVETTSSNPNLPLHWKSVKTGTNNAKFSYLNTGHTGNRSLKVAITKYTSGLAYFQYDGAPVEENKTYEYSFYHKSDVYSEIDAEITLASGEIVYQYLGVSFPSADWTRFATRIRMPEGAVSVRIYNILYAKGFLISDDFALSPVNIVPLSRPIVSITYDDYFSSIYDTVFPMFQERGLTGTAYLSTQDLGKPDTLTAPEINEMHDYGFEIGSHTVTHAHLPFISSSLVDTELSQSKADIESFTGITPINFASPYGEYNDAIKEQIKTYYRSHRSVDVGFNTKDNFDIMNIKAMSTINSTPPETVIGWIDDAIRDNAWLVLVYHNIIDDGDTWTNTPAHMRTVLDSLVTRGVSVQTVDSALNEIVPQI